MKDPRRRKSVLRPGSADAMASAMTSQLSEAQIYALKITDNVQPVIKKSTVQKSRRRKELLRPESVFGEALRLVRTG